MQLKFPEFISSRKTISEIVIVGSGPAAMATAYALEQKGISCVLLESGEPDKAERWDIKTNGFTAVSYGVPESYPELHVRRQPGGGLNVWSGWCSALREVNFARPDLPTYPSWPITKADLVPHYREAASWLKIPDFEKSLEDGVEVADSGLTVKLFRFSPPLRFSGELAQHVATSQKITLVTGATVAGLEGSGGRITGIEVLAAGGQHKVPCEGAVVLAGGAVGNARILALSGAAGIAESARAFVGKYFFEHPHCYSVANIAFSPEMEDRLADKAYWSQGFISLAPTKAFLEKTGSTDFNFQLWPIPGNELEPREQAISHNHEKIYGRKPQFYRASLGMEQAVHVPTDIVLDADTLARKNDGHLSLDLGVQKQVIHVAKKWIQANGACAWVGPEKEPPIVAVGHLMGTTRMSRDPANGVVDGNCLVHGTTNLFVAGGSVFPTGGFTNPTFTIAALAFRLGGHLAKEIQ